MTLNDFIPVIVPLNRRENDVYQDIALSAGLSNPIIVDVDKHLLKEGEYYYLDKEPLAREVAEAVGKRKSVIIGRKHFNIAFCYPEETLITFDAHNDSMPHGARSFDDGYFLSKRKGKTYILGCRIKSYSNEVINYWPKKINQILEEKLPRNIFLSLEIDVFNSNVTRAHNYAHDSWLDNAGRFFGLENHLCFERVLDLSKELVKGKNVLGINLSGYNPWLEKPPYPTSGLLKQYLSSVLSDIKS